MVETAERSGLPRASIEGTGSRRSRLASLASEPRTLVFFEAPHRLAGTLADMAAAFGPDRAAALCRELTKTHEEVRRASLGGLAAWARSQAVRGEITLVVAGAQAAAATLSTEDLAGLVDAAEARGLSRRDAVAAVAQSTGVARRVVYAAALGSR